MLILLLLNIANGFRLESMNITFAWPLWFLAASVAALALRNYFFVSINRINLWIRPSSDRPAVIAKGFSELRRLLMLIKQGSLILFSAVVFAPFSNSDHAVASVCIDVPSNLKGNVSFHCIAFHYLRLIVMILLIM